MSVFTFEEIKKHIIQEKDDGQYEFYLMDSMESFVKYCNPANLINNKISAKQSSNQYWFNDCNARQSDDWAFGPAKTRENFIKRVDNWDGIKEVEEEIEKQKQQFLSDPRVKEAFKRLVTYKRNKKFTIDDGELIFERVMSGDPEYYQKTLKKSIKKGIRILVNFTQSCNMTPATFAKNTVEMFKLAYVFELMGVPVQILAGGVAMNTSADRHFSAVLFLLKSEFESINLQKSALLAYPGFLRDLSFSGRALMFNTKVNSGQGSNGQEVPKKFLELAECDFTIGQFDPADKIINELLKLVK